MADKNKNIEMKADGQNMVIIEQSADKTVFDNPPEEVSLSYEGGVLSSDTDSECRIVVKNIGEEETFYQSDYIGLICEFAIVVGEMYGVQPFRVIEAVECELSNR